MSLIYNALMVLVDVAALATARRRRGWLARVACLVPAAAAGVGFGAVLGEGHFGQIRLWSYGFFAHGIILLLGLAAITLRSPRPQARANAESASSDADRAEADCPWAVAIWFAVACVLGAAVLGGIALDAFLIEPLWLEATHVRLTSPKIERPIRLVVLADLQTLGWGDYERGVFRRAAEEKPDIVLFLGDYLQGNDRSRTEQQAQFPKVLRESGLQAPLGMFAIRGNCEDSDWPNMFRGLPVTCIDRTESLDVGPIRLTGLEEHESRYGTRGVPASDRYQVVIGHHPDFALHDCPADLLLAGHTHGGQVRLPLIGPITTLSTVPRRWGAGVTDLGNGRTLIVSRGIGMERDYAPRLRFLCRPELLVIDLAPSNLTPKAH